MLISFAVYVFATSLMSVPTSGARIKKREAVLKKAEIPNFSCASGPGVNNCWQLPVAQKSAFCKAFKNGEIDAKSAAAVVNRCVWCAPSDVEQICDVLDIAAAAVPGPSGQGSEQSKKCGAGLARALEENARGMSNDALGCHSLPEFFGVVRGTARELFETKKNKRTGKPLANPYLSCNANADNYFSALCDTYFPTCLTRHDTDISKPGRPNFISDGGTFSCATAQFDPSAQPVVKPERPKGLHHIPCAEVLKTFIEETVDKSAIMSMCSSKASYFDHLISTKALTEDGPKFWKKPEEKTCYKSYDNYFSTVCWSYQKTCKKYLGAGEKGNDIYGNPKPMMTINFQGKDYSCQEDHVQFDDYLD